MFGILNPMVRDGLYLTKCRHRTANPYRWLLAFSERETTGEV
jgi:hypothetical protein